MEIIFNSFKNRVVDIDKPIYVYRNLNSTCDENKYSIIQNGLVVAHTNQLQIVDVNFIVRPAGKKRANTTNERNVHAFIKGYVKDIDVSNIDSYYPLKYDPFNDDEFMFITPQGNSWKIKNCKSVIINELGIFLKLF